MVEAADLGLVCPDTNVIVHLALATPVGDRYRAALSGRRIALTDIALSELEAFRFRPAERERIERLLRLAVQLGRAGPEVRPFLQLASDMRDRLGLTDAVSAADLEIIALCAWYSALFFSHDRAAVRVADALAVPTHTELPNMSLYLAHDAQTLARE